jgi:hypothetical protein
VALGGARLYAGEVQLPSVALAGVPFEIAASGFAPQTRVQIRFEDAQGNRLAQTDAVADESGAASLQARLPQAGTVRYVWQAGDASGRRYAARHPRVVEPAAAAAGDCTRAAAAGRSRSRSSAGCGSARG